MIPAREPIRVTVAIATFRRNEHLTELIPLLRAQGGELGADGRYVVRVLIIDNDPQGGAREVVATLAASGEAALGCPVVYCHEPTPGLTAVRNRALAESPDQRLVAFMDDDGRPAAGWLAGLVSTWADTGAEAVAGRVLEEYESEPSRWIRAGGFFTRRSLTTGTVVAAAPAGNLLLDLDAVRAHGLRFDPRFGLTGGEDTLFTTQLTAAGGRIVWCEQAAVVDLVPTDRMTPRWVLARAWSHGNTAALVRRAMAGSTRQALAGRVSCAAGGIVRVVVGGARAAIGFVLRSPHHQARGLRVASRGAGLAAGALGHVVREYERAPEAVR